MNEFIPTLIKFTAVFVCVMYAYAKLLRLKLKARDVFAVPLFAAFSAAMYFIKMLIKILVPLCFLLFGASFAYLRFRKSLYETVTVSMIALSISIVLFAFSIIIGYPVAATLHFIKNNNFRILIA